MLSDRDLAAALAAQSARSNPALQILLDLIPAGVVIADSHGSITLHNQRADEIYGGSVTGNAYGPSGGYTLLRPNGTPFPPHDLPLPRAIDRCESIQDVEIIVKRADGSERIVLAAGRPIRSDDGQILGAIAVIQDVTEREQANHRLRARECQQAAVAALGQAALANPNIDQLLGDAVRCISDTLAIECVTVLEALPKRDEVLLRASVGTAVQMVGRLFDAGLDSPAGYALRSAQPLIVEDFRTETRFKAPSILQEHGVVSGMNVIIHGYPKPFGILGVYTVRRRAFTEDDINFVKSVANILAMAVDRARADDVLRRQAQVLNQIHDAVVVTDLAGNVTSWNDGAERLSGYAAAEALGRHISFVYAASRYPEGPRAFLEQHVVAPLLAHGSLEIDVAMQRKSGELLDVRIRLSLLRDRAGTVTETIGYSMDVTERINAERERAQWVARERALAQIAQALVQSLDLTHVVETVIEQSQAILAADIVALWLADPVRRKLRLLQSRGPIQPDLLTQVQEISFDAPTLASRAASTNAPQIIEDTRNWHGDLAVLRMLEEGGRLRSALAHPLRARGHLVGVVVYGWQSPRRLSPTDLAFDATIADLCAVAIENARLYEEVRLALHVREEFMSAAAHELRTPLTIIKGHAQLMLHGGVDDSQCHRSLASIDKHADRMTRIVNDLLLAVQVRPGLAVLEKARVDLNALAASAAEWAARRAREQQVQLDSEGPLFVEVSADLVSEVLVRLIENALTYSPPDGAIDVRIWRENYQAVATVRDHGVGIEAERLPHVFEPFFEPIPPGTNGYTGVVSLGLYLSKQIIEAHGGRIWAQSTPGQGSTFSFSLPLLPRLEESR